MKQPKVYNNEVELIRWLEYDLNKQREKIAKNKSIKKSLVKDNELRLNIGSKNKIGFNFFTIENFNRIDNYRIKINFEFRIDKIINKLIRTNNNDCPFYINANNIEFNEAVIISSHYNQNVDYNHSIFNKEVNCCLSKFYKEVNFKNSIFKSYANFSSCYFYDNANFYKVSFQYVDFYETNFESGSSFNDTNFINGCSFLLSYFNKNVYLNSVKFYDYCDFRGINSSNIIDFTNSEFYGCFDLTDCDCKGINLNYSEINGKLYIGKRITSSRYSKFIYMDNIILKDKDSLISIENCYFKYMKLKNIFNNGIIYLKNIKSANIDLYGTVILGHIFVINCEFKNLKNWQTARIFKHEEYKKSNSIKALEYHAEETKLYKKELLNKQNKTLKDWFDIISIFLSSLYSNNGQNWGQSFLCTLIIPSIFFAISYIPSNVSYFLYILSLSYLFIRFKCKDIVKYILTSIFAYIVFCGFLPTFYLYGLNKLLNINFFKELLRFLTPTNFEAITNINDKETISYIYKNNNIVETIIKSLSYFLGKIAFWYGSVQTVQAFRKFSKGA